MPPTTASPLTVLVAEDEPAMLSLVARHMRSLGFSVVEASDGDTAWELAQKHHPDLVVLDVMMPGMSGWEVCKRLKSSRESSEFSATAVIMLTGIGENLNDMTSPLYAADGWLNKPFDFSELDQKLGEVLKQYGRAMPQHRAPASKKSNAKESARAPAPSTGARKKEGSGVSRVSTANKAAAPAKPRAASKVRTGGAGKKAQKASASKTKAGPRRSK